jgi:hypothetical protein
MTEGQRKTVAHGEAVLRARREWPDVQTLLILEDDYRWIWQWSMNRGGFGNLPQFVSGGQWRILRIGYNPIGDLKALGGHIQQVARKTFSRNETCPEVCRCRRVSEWVCSIEIRNQSFCDIRSMVAYAVHASAFDAMEFAMNQTLRGSVIARFFDFYLDKWLPALISPLHYVVPGMLTDSTPQLLWKQEFAGRMTAFANACPYNLTVD